MTKSVTSVLRTFDDRQLVGEHHGLEEAVAEVVIVHGYAEHRGRYAELVRVLTQSGFECHLLDLRGHGGSDGKRGHVKNFWNYRDDLGRFLRSPALRNGDRRPRFLFGHSLGGLIALDFALTSPSGLSGLALSCPFLSPAFQVSWSRRWLARVLSVIAPSAAVKSGLDPNGLSKDPAIVETYRQDPRVFDTVTPGWFVEVSRVQERILERTPDLTLPTLFQVGDTDPVADPSASQAAFDSLAGTNKEILIYKGCLHEIFNELGRARVQADLLDWLVRQVTP